MSKINLSIFLLCSILTACVSSNSYFVRFWNGDVIPKRTYEHQHSLRRRLGLHRGSEVVNDTVSSGWTQVYGKEELCLQYAVS